MQRHSYNFGSIEATIFSVGRLKAMGVSVDDVYTTHEIFCEAMDTGQRHGAFHQSEGLDFLRQENKLSRAEFLGDLKDSHVPEPERKRPIEFQVCP